MDASVAAVGNASKDFQNRRFNNRRRNFNRLAMVAELSGLSAEVLSGEEAAAAAAAVIGVPAVADDVAVARLDRPGRRLLASGLPIDAAIVVATFVSAAAAAAAAIAGGDGVVVSAGSINTTNKRE